jgi:hypothetical protein
MEKAIKPNATSEIRESFSMPSTELNPKPSIPNDPRKYGPTKTPAIKYAVTAGK